MTFEIGKLTNIQFLLPGQDRCDSWTCHSVQSFDYWIDDVSFYAGRPPCSSAVPLSCQGMPSMADASLETTARQAVGNPSGNWTCEDLGTVYSLTASTEDLEGLQCLANLRSLELTTLPSSNLTRLGELSQLSMLALSSSGSDIGPLANLTQLTMLILNGNQITNISPLSSLTQVTTLNLSSNQITDISPLLALPQLQSLNIWQNPLVCSVQVQYLQMLSQRGVKITSSNCQY